MKCSHNQKCPNCDSEDVERVDLEEVSSGFEEVWICNDCPHQWIVEYGDPVIVNEQHFDEKDVNLSSESK